MPTRLDLTGNVYGELTVDSMLYNYNNKHRTYCKCFTDNGEEVIVRADALQSGATKHAKGAGKTGKPIDIRGRTFGLLKAIRPTDERAGNGSIIWECECVCGSSIMVPAGQLLRKHTMSCGCKHQSKWEMYIGGLLTSYGIIFEPQKRFSDCKNKKQSDMLPFDFYLPSYNMCIEYDGIHHFEPVPGWGGNEKFKITQENDKIKNDYCLMHNITLLRLPYTYTEDEIKNEILNILSPVTITA